MILSWVHDSLPTLVSALSGIVLITYKGHILCMAEAGMGDVDRLTSSGANIAKDYSVGNTTPRLCSKCLKNEGITIIEGSVYCEACTQLMRMAEYKKDPEE